MCQDLLDHPWLVHHCERRRLRRLRVEGRNSLGGAALLLGGGFVRRDMAPPLAPVRTQGGFLGGRVGLNTWALANRRPAQTSGVEACGPGWHPVWCMLFVKRPIGGFRAKKRLSTTGPVAGGPWRQKRPQGRSSFGSRGVGGGGGGVESGRVESAGWVGPSMPSTSLNLNPDFRGYWRFGLD